MIRFVIPVRTSNPLNGSQGRTRGAVLAKAAQRKRHREAARILLSIELRRRDLVTLWKPAVTLTRISAGTLDTDGLQAALKSCRDGIADALGVGDGAEGPIAWHYQQRKGKRGHYGVEVEIT